MEGSNYIMRVSAKKVSPLKCTSTKMHFHQKSVSTKKIILIKKHFRRNSASTKTRLHQKTLKKRIVLVNLRKIIARYLVSKQETKNISNTQVLKSN